MYLRLAFDGQRDVAGIVLQVGLEEVAAMILPMPLDDEHEDQEVLAGGKAGRGEVVVDAVDVQLPVGRGAGVATCSRSCG